MGRFKLQDFLISGGTVNSSVRSKDNSGNTSSPSQGDGWRAVTQWKSQDSNPPAMTGGGVYTSLLQPDNKRILGGDFTSPSYDSGKTLFRKLTPLGGDDLIFSNNEGTGFNNEIYTIALQPDGKILVGGNFSTYNDTSQGGITRLNADGTQDASFPIGTGFNGVVIALALQSDGKILVGGDFSAYNGTSQGGIARLNADGSLDSSFSTGEGFNGFVYTIVVQPDGKILVGGWFTTYHNTTQICFTRLNADGSLDSSFSMGTGFDGYVYTIVVQPDGKILVGGWFTNYNGTDQHFFTRLNTDGSLDSSFSMGTGFNGYVYTSAVQPDGKILVGGYFTNYNGTDQLFFTRLNADGSLDPSFSVGTGFDNLVIKIAVQPDGKILVGGNFSTYNDIIQPAITRLNADGSWDASWNRKDGYLTSYVYTMAISSDGGVLVGGDFGSTHLNSQTRLTRLGSDGVRDLSFSVGTGFNNFVRSLGLQSDGKILVGGGFTTYQGVSQNYIVRLASDGSQDPTFSVGTGFNGYVNVIAIQSDGKILAGGNFTSYNGTSRTYVARINTDGSLDTTFSLTGTGLNNSVRVIIPQTDGKIILGGDFTTYNGVSQPYIIRLNTNGTKDSSFATTGTGINGFIYTLALQPNGSILAGGTFSQYNGTSKPYLLRLQSNGTLDTSFSLTGSGLDDEVYSISIQTDGKILVGGAFTSYNGTTQSYMTRLNADGSRDTSFLVRGGGFNDVVITLSLQNTGKILVGGVFTTYYDTTGSMTYTTLLGW